MLDLRHSTFERILIVKPSSLGDIVRALPVLHGLRRRFSKTMINWLVRPEFADILPGKPALDEKILFDRKRFARLGISYGATRDFLQLLRQLRRRQFDLVIDLQGLFRSGFITRATGAPVRVGFAHAREGAARFYTHPIKVDPDLHHVEECRQVARAIGVDTESLCFDMNLDAEATTQAVTLLMRFGLGQGEGYYVILPGGTHEAKRWPVANWVELVTSLKKIHNIRLVILAGGGEEKAIAEAITQGKVGQRPTLHADAGVINLAGQTTLRQLVALLKEARWVVGNDSGPLHIAAALGTPVVGLYGPTNPRLVGPFGQMDGVVQAGSDIPRRRRYSPHPDHAMKNIAPKLVIDAINRKYPI
ncbi:MAG: lipopolysaccharide heptosyltransferase I [Sedimentisphaerales bacterium]|nr:lipopolysaccharide heptosyltransferase I [Sedimentisphaerales bacterium]